MLTDPIVSGRDTRGHVAVVFGTRPEIIKLAPVITALDRGVRVTSIHTGQHGSLAAPVLHALGVRVDHELDVMREGSSVGEVVARVLVRVGAVLERERPDVLLVQGDTASCLAGALAAYYAHVPVGHVEAGLRSGDPRSPFPEEMNRRLVSRIAAIHFAATERNRRALLAEGVDGAAIHVTGNTGVDALDRVRRSAAPSSAIAALLEEIGDARLVVLTTHRRENFGERMRENLEVLARFIAHNEDTALVLPVHPNPAVTELAGRTLSGRDRIHLVEPMGHADFILLLERAWLCVSDSGGVQEEVPSLGTPLIVLRENTERPEVVESGFAVLSGGDPARLEMLLGGAGDVGGWADAVRARRAPNPFGDGHAGEGIADLVLAFLAERALVG